MDPGSPWKITDRVFAVMHVIIERIPDASPADPKGFAFSKGHTGHAYRGPLVLVSMLLRRSMHRPTVSDRRRAGSDPPETSARQADDVIATPLSNEQRPQQVSTERRG
jgi:hypothetical protein